MGRPRIDNEFASRGVYAMSRQAWTVIIIPRKGTERWRQLQLQTKRERERERRAAAKAARQTAATTCA